VATLRDLQQVVGIVLAIYGFFVATQPNQFTVPFLNYLIANPTSQEQQWVGAIMVIVGVILFTRKKPVFEL
jgi:drug/metabolite transporter (DMT)-like permease